MMGLFSFMVANIVVFEKCTFDVELCLLLIYWPSGVALNEECEKV